MVKALAVLKPGAALEDFEYDAPPLKATDVEIKVSHCGVCHSDLSMINNEWGATSFPLVPGHEVVGTISKIGASVKSFEIGDHVGLGWHAAYCEHCDYCNTGDHNLCAQTQPTIVGRHGGFAETVQAAASAVVRLPEGIDLASAGPLFCGGITVFNPMVQFDIKPENRVGVIGIGGLGHLALQFLNAWGCNVTAFTSSASKFEEAKSLGAHHVIDSTDVKQLKAASNQFDFIICTVNVSLDWSAYIKTLAPRGRLHFVGVLTDPLALSVAQMMSKQIQISSSPVGSPSTIKRMLDFAVRHNIQPQVEVFPFEQANDAIEKLKNGHLRYRAVLERS